MLIDDGRIAPEGEGWSAAEDLSSLAVPASIHALITARLDRLDPEERTVVERGSVEGNLFHVGGVAALAPDVTGVPQRLMALVRKEFIRPDKADFGGRRRLPLPSPADPRLRVRIDAQARASVAARALRGLARSGRGRRRP